MGQKVNPISNRLGIVKGWDSNWFGGKNFGENLVEDQKIRKYLNERLAKASISKIVGYHHHLHSPSGSGHW